MINEQVKSRIKTALFWIRHLFFPACLIWIGTSDSPSAYQMVVGISIIVVFVSVISLTIIGIKYVLKKTIPRHRPIRPAISIVISLVILSIWDTAYDDAKQHLWQVAEEVQQACKNNGCIGVLENWKSRDPDEGDDFIYKYGAYQNRLNWHLQYTANKHSFELFWYLGFDGPIYGICGGIDKELRLSDSQCRPTRSNQALDETHLSF